MATLTGIATASLCAGSAVLVVALGSGSRQRLWSILGDPRTADDRSAPSGVDGQRATVATAVVAVLTSVLLRSLSFAVLSAVAAIATPVVLRARAAARHETEIQSEVPAVLTALAAELRAGRPLAAALATVASDATPPLARRLLGAGAAVERGVDVAPVLLASGDEPLVRALRPLASALSLAGSGARLATVVDRLAAATRADTRVHDAVRAELAGPAASAALLGALPLVGLALATATGGDPLARLATSPLGLVALVVGVALDISGLLWARQIVRSVTPRW